MHRYFLDKRSLGLLRVMLALWILLDLANRSLLDTLAWYTDRGDNPPPLVDPADTRHKLWLHQLWFFRGPWMFQAFVFALHALVVVAWGSGWRCHATGPLLWFLQTALHGRNEMICDGTDKTVRYLLMWLALTPHISDCFGVGAPTGWMVPSSLEHHHKKTDNGVAEQEREEREEDDAHSATTQQRARRRQGSGGSSAIPVIAVGAAAAADDDVKGFGLDGLEAFSLVLQIAISYLTMVGRRLLNPLGTAWNSGDATHYALRWTFRVRQQSRDLTMWLRPDTMRLGTHLALVVEVLGPVLLLVSVAAPGSRKNTTPTVAEVRTNIILQWMRMIGITVIIFGVQVPLLFMFRLERFTLLSIIAPLGFLPSLFWDRLLCPRLPMWCRHTTRSRHNQHPPTTTATNTPVAYDGKSRLHRARKLVLWVMLFYMVSSCTSSALHVGKWDNGDLGELVRFDQMWVMFENPSRLISPYWAIDGDRYDSSWASPMSDAPRIDLLAALKTGDYTIPSPVDDLLALPPTYRYPTFFWEKFLLYDAAPSEEFFRFRNAPLLRYICHRWGKEDVAQQQERRKVTLSRYEYTTKPPRADEDADFPDNTFFNDFFLVFRMEVECESV